MTIKASTMPEWMGVPLTAAQSAFAYHYAWSLNAVAAVRASGYPTKNPQNVARLWLSKRTVQFEILKIRQDAKAKHEGVQQWLIRELVSIAGADIGDLMQQASDGSIELRPLEAMPEDTRRAIAEIQQSALDKDGKRQLKLKLTPKMQAMTLLARIMGLEQQVVTHDVTGELAAHVRSARGAIERATFARSVDDDSGSDPEPK